MKETKESIEHLERVADCLRKNGFDAKVFIDPNGMADYFLDKIGAHDTVGLGGSVTIAETGIIERLELRGNIIYNPYVQRTRKEEMDTRRKCLLSDWFITGSNAVTENGQLVNVDGLGSRVSAIAFGPKNVLIVVGKNKIVPDVEGGFQRIKDLSAPKNAKRRGNKTPCVDGRCPGYVPGECICNIQSVINGDAAGRIHIALIYQEMGY